MHRTKSSPSLPHSLTHSLTLTLPARLGYEGLFLREAIAGKSWEQRSLNFYEEIISWIKWLSLVCSGWLSGWLASGDSSSWLYSISISHLKIAFLCWHSWSSWRQWEEEYTRRATLSWALPTVHAFTVRTVSLAHFLSTRHIITDNPDCTRWHNQRNEQTE